MNVLFEAQEVTKQFANHKALDEVSLKVPEKSIFGLLGPNGAGKTTLIRTLLGIIRPTKGTASVLGYDIRKENVTPIGSPALVKPINNGMLEQEQNGVIVPKSAPRMLALIPSKLPSIRLVLSGGKKLCI